MVRQIVIPEKTRQFIDLPEEYLGEPVEITAVRVNEKTPSPDADAEKQARIDRLEKALEGYQVSLKGYKFNRDEANDYE